MMGEFLSLLQSSGLVTIPLVGLAALLWYGLGVRTFMLRRHTKKPVTHLWHDARRGKLTGAGVLATATERCAQLKPSPGATLRVQEIVLGADEELKRFATSIRLVVVTAPLCGLLGTVAGMIETFRALGNMALFSQTGGIAGGISQALISTELGLIVAIPGLIIGRLLARREEHLREDLMQLQSIAQGELRCAEG